MRTIILCGISALLAGCITTQPEAQKSWLRTDGKQISGSVALQQQLETDKIICEGEVQKAKLSHTERRYAANGSEGFAELADYMAKNNSLEKVANGCMASKGYILAR